MAHYPGFLTCDEDAGPEGEALEQCRPLRWPGIDKLDMTFVKALIARLLSASYRSPDLLSLFALNKNTLTKLLVYSKEAFARDENIVDITTPPAGRVHVLGDTHGDLHSLVEALSMTGWPADDNILCFAGDCVDRGSWGVEVFVVILALKLCKPRCVVLLRGNHESTGCTARYGFRNEVLRKYDERVLLTFFKTFNEIPCAAVITTLPRVFPKPASASQHTSQPPTTKEKGRRGKWKQGARDRRDDRTELDGWRAPLVPGERRILVLHGGLFRSWKSPKKGSMALGNLNDLAETRRQLSDPQHCILEDVLWSDPQIDASDVALNVLRGAGILFGNGAAESFFRRNNLHGLIRAHEGPDMREKREGMDDMLGGYSVDIELISSFVATVFSAADYPPDRPRSNKGAFATLQGADIQPLKILPDFTQFEKQCSPDDKVLFYIPPDSAQAATPRTSVS